MGGKGEGEDGGEGEGEGGGGCGDCGEGGGVGGGVGGGGCGGGCGGGVGGGGRCGMTDLEKAAQQALDALERIVQHKYPDQRDTALKLGQIAIDALRAAGARQQAEPPAIFKHSTEKKQ